MKEFVSSVRVLDQGLTPEPATITRTKPEASTSDGTRRDDVRLDDDSSSHERMGTQAGLEVWQWLDTPWPARVRQQQGFAKVPSRARSGVLVLTPQRNVLGRKGKWN
jgi:hypothetical protein